MNVQGKLFDLKGKKSVEHEEGKHAVRKYLQQESRKMLPYFWFALTKNHTIQCVNFSPLKSLCYFTLSLATLSTYTLWCQLEVTVLLIGTLLLFDPVLFLKYEAWLLIACTELYASSIN